MLRVANIRKFIQHGFLPAVLAASALAYSSAVQWGLSLVATVTTASLAALLLGLLVERLLPWRADWNRGRGDLQTDLTSMAVLMGGVDPLLKLGAAMFIAWLYGALPRESWVLTDWPFLLQVALAGLVMEFGAYWMHRWHHRHPCLWSLHAMHHGTERLYGLNNFRVHPFNYALQFAAGTVPLLIAGVPQEVLLAWLAVSQPIVMLQHLNADLRNGWLNQLFSTNELHRWHHADDDREGDVNFGSALILWDRVFRTYRPVMPGDGPASVGLFPASRGYPSRAGYLAQIGVLCGRRCCAN